MLSGVDRTKRSTSSVARARPCRPSATAPTTAYSTPSRLRARTRASNRFEIDHWDNTARPRVARLIGDAGMFEVHMAFYSAPPGSGRASRGDTCPESASSEAHGRTCPVPGRKCPPPTRFVEASLARCPCDRRSGIVHSSTIWRDGCASLMVERESLCSQDCTRSARTSDPRPRSTHDASVASSRGTRSGSFVETVTTNSRAEATLPGLSSATTVNRCILATAATSLVYYRCAGK